MTQLRLRSQEIFSWFVLSEILVLAVLIWDEDTTPCWMVSGHFHTDDVKFNKKVPRVTHRPEEFDNRSTVVGQIKFHTKQSVQHINDKPCCEGASRTLLQNSSPTQTRWFQSVQDMFHNNNNNDWRLDRRTTLRIQWRLNNPSMSTFLHWISLDRWPTLRRFSTVTTIRDNLRIDNLNCSRMGNPIWS